MDISFADLKEKEIINVFDGKKLGHIVDILFDVSSGIVQGVFVPGEKKLFKRGEDIFVPLEKIKKIGDDVILVKLQVDAGNFKVQRNDTSTYSSYMANNSYGGYNAMQNNRQQMMQNARYNSNSVPVQGGGVKSSSFVRFRPINNIKYK